MGQHRRRAGCPAVFRQPVNHQPTLYIEASNEMPLRAAPFNEAIFGRNGKLRTITLNRPAKLNSLNLSMIKQIRRRIDEWQKSDLCSTVLIQGDARAFCAGGDVTTLADACADGRPEEADYFFAEEYALDHAIALYPKPFIAFMDGITMGGGVGLSVHAPFRVCTERTVFAMPETTIGFFPDVGAGFFLPRMDGRVGTFLAMTSHRLKGWEVYMSGIATHYVESEKLPMVRERLAEVEGYDGVNAALEEYASHPPLNHSSKNYPFIGSTRKAIDRCFSKDSVEGVINSLQKEGEWGAGVRKTMEEKSPTSLAVALRQMQLGRQWSILETFQREHYLATRFMRHPDFVTGVNARLRTKTTPHWGPLEDIKPFFSSSSSLDIKGSFPNKQYPTSYGLPSEWEIENVVKGYAKGSGSTALSRSEVLQQLSQDRRKVGMEDRVNEVLDRRTVEEDGVCRWV